MQACGRGLSRLVPSACAETPPRAAPLRPVSSGQLYYYPVMTSFISPPVYFRIYHLNPISLASEIPFYGGRNSGPSVSYLFVVAWD